MSLPQEVVNEVFQVIEGGTPLGTPAEIIQFPTDNGQSVYNVVQKTYQGTNGTGFNYWVVAFETLIGSVATAVSAGAAMLTLEVGTVGLGVAACLGLTTGYVLYELTPDFWNDVSERLVNAGQTIGGKVIAFMNKDGNLTYSPETIEIIKNAFLDNGAFIPIDSGDVPQYVYESYPNLTTPFNYNVTDYFKYKTTNYWAYFSSKFSTKIKMFVGRISANNLFWFLACSDKPFLYGTAVNHSGYPNPNPTQEPHYVIINNKPVYYMSVYGYDVYELEEYDGIRYIGVGVPYELGYLDKLAYNILYGGEDVNGNPYIQDGAELPDENPFDETYPDWIPWEFPIIDPEGDPQQLPDRYPVEYPDLLPEIEPYQDPAQNPDPATENDPDEVVKTLQDPDNDPSREIEPEPEPEPDPDPQPDPDPLPDEGDPVVDPDPIDPNPEPDPSLPIVVPNLPTTVDSNKLFTVYNPTQAQIDALGGYLWDGSIIAAIRDIWQEPLDGVISLLQIYATPTTSGSHNIILGFLDSGVSAAVVSNQFVTVDCGSVTVPEKKNNATDYAPYTTLHLYLPFIGIVELDTNECMNATISVKYRIDVYTGTCLATVSVDRDADMPNDPILYTYSGNCSQQIPLTSGNATGMLSALIGGITAGLSVASGGGLGVLAGASIAGQSLTHEMFHVSHSGNISANAGIMGIKKPYLIIGRRHNYDANNYNKFYGFPVNKTVILGNHTGYVEVKSGFLKTNATQPEHDEIMSLLKQGVIL